MRTLCLVFVCAVLSSCVTTGTEQKSKANDDSTIFALMKVDDMAAWTQGFKEARGTRASAGIKKHEIYTAADGSGQVLVILQTYSAQMAGNLLQTRLPRQWVAAAMAKDATFQMAGTVLSGSGKDSLFGAEIGIVWVRHEVSDVDMWVKNFVAHAGHGKDKEHQSDHRRVGHTVYGNLDYPRLLHVVHWVDDLEKAGEFMNGAQLRTAMAKSGVIGQPVVWLGKLVEEMVY